MEVFKTYHFGKTYLEYLLDDDKNVSMLLYPESKKDQLLRPWTVPEEKFNPRNIYTHGFYLGKLVHSHIVGEYTTYPGHTSKAIDEKCELVSQELIEEGDRKIVKTLMNTVRGCQLMHTLTYVEGLGGFEVESTFINASKEDVRIDMLSSFSLDNLSPFHMDDAPNCYNLHRFLGGPSKEAKPVCQSFEELSLEKGWPGWQQLNQYECFGTRGSWPTKKYFPTAVIEDKTVNVFWGAQIACNSTWMMEVTRWDDAVSFTGGLGDREFCGWVKNIKAGEQFTAPKAYVATSDVDLLDVCANLTDMMKPARWAYGEEKGLPIAYNEYCATWGKPTQEKFLNYAREAKRYGVRYMVCDAGWTSGKNCQAGNGEWIINTDKFPNMKEMNREIREMGMIPGIWFEHEVTTDGSPLYEKEYDHMHLTFEGQVLKTWNRRSFWDFRRQDVQDHLYERVIKMMKDNGFGYIKVDYNDNIGTWVDGAESGAEGLRQHQLYCRDFFLKMKREIPGLVIENCAAGGHRNEPSMLTASAICSFSDAHECVEIPYIAANLHYVLLPAQSGVWAVVHGDDSVDRLRYSLAALFLGRVCLSGKLDELAEWQKVMIEEAMKFYGNLENIIEDGRSKLYGNRSASMRHPEGVQVLTRQTEDEMLIVYHAFADDMQDCTFEIPAGFTVADSFHGDNIHVNGTTVTVSGCKPFTAGAVYLKK